ncbi:amidohydrolase family protein [Paracidovorax avenae]|uniref:amidohydrolase family protein n=1 Tax=Paracidovorax avenae TaxID=80867 RepID=UPI0001BF543B|nr:amidohydrolase family protein [Paracidovorax avenae]AVS65427.1 thioesterase [Paracidovorax avenae]
MNADLQAAREEFLAAQDDRLLPIVDAHHHFWDLGRNPHLWLQREPPIAFRYGDYRAIRRDFLPEHYQAEQGGHRVLRHVLMEGGWDPRDPIGEALWVDQLARRTGKPHALAAQAWLDGPELDAQLEAYARLPLVRSVRHKPRSVPRAEHRAGYAAPGSMRCPRWRSGYARLEHAGLMFELQAPWWHFGEAAELARDFPRTRIIVNHAGLPVERGPESLAAWRRALETLAREPQVFLKISGLGVPGRRWTPELQAPVVHDAISIFGWERCLFASNHPVDALVAPLAQIFQGFKQLTAARPARQRLALFCDNAARLYGLD